MRLLGLPEAENVDWFRDTRVGLASTASVGYTPLFQLQVVPFLRQWDDLRNQRRYEEADSLRRKLEAIGLRVSATKTGPHADIPNGFDPAKLDALK
jgi:cysteinyl-tRNA synthetase